VQSASPQELVSDDVHLLIHRKPSCRIELDVKVSKNIVSRGRKEAIKAVSKDISLPGFRKGKAPESLIVKKFPNDIERQLHKSIADIAFVEAQKIANIPLLNTGIQISFDLKSQTDEGAHLIFTFETEPKIPTVDPKQFQSAPIPRLEVADKQIDEAIRQMMFFYAEWKPVKDRGVQEGDFIMIDLDKIEGENAQRVFHHIRFEVAAERMAQWMRDLVFNAKEGDVLDGTSTPDDTASEKEREEFLPKKVRLHLLKVEQAILPELNDDLAKKVGAADVAGMRQSIAHILNQKADEKVQNLLRDQVNDFLVQKYPFDLPHSLIETERKHRHNQLLNDPNFRKKWDAMAQAERKKIEDKLVEESEQAVRLFYLSRQVVHEAKIPITHKEVQDEAVAILHEHRVSQIDKISKEVFALALSKVVLRKAQDYITESAKSLTE